MRRAALALLCAALAAIPFFGALGGAFVWGDRVLIVENPQLGDWREALQGFTRPALERENVAYYRPVLMASYVADRQLFGLDAGAFRRTNVVLHAANVALVFALLLALVRSASAAAFGALLFGLHPLQGQAVALPLGRNDLLLLPTVVVSLLAYRAWAVARGGRRVALHGLLVALYALCLWTKETGIVLPALFAAYDLTIGRRGIRDLTRHATLAATLLGVAVMYFAARLAIFGFVGSGGAYGDAGLFERLSQVVATLGYYAQKALLPLQLAAAPYQPRLADPLSNDFLLAVLLLAGSVGVCLRFRQRRPVTAFGIALFLLWLVPVSGLASMKIPILEHRAYAALLGMALVAAALLEALPARARVPVSLAVLCVLALETTGRMPVYRDALSLWASASRNAPESLYARREYGRVLVEAGRPEDALPELDAALRLRPGLIAAIYDRARALEGVGRRDEAVAELQRIVRERPHDLQALRALAVIRERQQHFTDAARLWGEVLRLAPSDPAHHEARGRNLHNAARYERAVGAFREALRLGGDTGAVHFGLGYALYKAGRSQEAVPHARRAAELGFADARLVRRLEVREVAVR